jgi:hypothetical protein
VNPYRYGDDPQFMGPPSPADIRRLSKKQGQPFFVGPPAPAQPGVNEQMQAYAAQQPEAPAQPQSPYSANPEQVSSDYSKLTAGDNVNAPGYRAEAKQKSQEGFKYGSVRNFLRTPEELDLMEHQAQGGKVRRMAGPDGTPLMRFNANTGEEEPIYEKLNEFDPENPVQQEKKGLGEMKDTLRTLIENRHVGIDLSPLASWADAQSGSHFAQSYKAPNNEHMIDDVLDYSNKIQERRKAIADAMNQEKQRMSGAGSFTDMLNGQAMLELMKGQHTPRPANTVGPQQKVTNDWAKLTTNDKDLRELRNEVQHAQKAYGLLDAKGEVQDSNLKIAIARMMGIGARITNFELMNEMGGPDFLNKIQTAYQKMTDGTMTDQDRENYKEMVVQMARNVNQFHQDRIKQLHSLGSTMGVDEGVISKHLGFMGDKAGTNLDKIGKKTGVKGGVPTPEGKTDAKSAADAKTDAELKQLMEETKKAKAILDKYGN